LDASDTVTGGAIDLEGPRPPLWYYLKYVSVRAAHVSSPLTCIIRPDERSSRYDSDSRELIVNGRVGDVRLFKPVDSIHRMEPLPPRGSIRRWAPPA